MVSVTQLLLDYSLVKLQSKLNIENSGIFHIPRQRQDQGQLTLVNCRDEQNQRKLKVLPFVANVWTRIRYESV